MATQTNVPQSVEQSKIAVVPFPAVQAITQLELTVLLSLRGRLHQLQEQVEVAEQSIKHASKWAHLLSLATTAPALGSLSGAMLRGAILPLA
jgi:hypothetical protein